MALATYYFTTMLMIAFQWCSKSAAKISNVTDLENLTGWRRRVDFTNSTSPNANFITLIAPTSNFLISTRSTVKYSKSDLGTSLANSSNFTFQTNYPNFCHLQIAEKALEDVLELMYIRTVNIIDLEVSFVSNAGRSFQKMKWSWASEIGRTLVTLVTRANEFIFASPVFTKILTVGTRHVNIEVVEEIDGCLPDGKKESDEIFKFLLQQLSRSDNTYSYGLCKAQKDESFAWTVYNCCRITGRRNLTICGGYTSSVVKHALPFIIAVFFLSFFLVLPFVLDYIRLFPSNDFYKTSESHMSLLSIASRIFFGESERKEVAMFRRSMIVMLIYFFLFHSTDFFGVSELSIIFLVWGIFFISYDVFKFSEEAKEHEKCHKCPLGTILITYLTKGFSKYLSFISDTMTKMSKSNIYDTLPKPFVFFFIGVFIIPFSLLITFLALLEVTLNLLFFSLFDFFNSYMLCLCDFKKSDSNPPRCWWSCCKPALRYIEYVCLFCVRFLTFPMVAVFTGSVFIFTVSIVVGLLLNGEFFNPFVAPIITIFIYFWRNWKFSVETKFLELKTAIVEVCKDQAPGRKNENENESPNDFHIKFDRDGEAMIPKDFYKKLSEDELRLNEILFHFFRRVTFVSVYAFVMYTVMTLARDSGVTESVQVITAIAGVLIPFVFDTIWAEESLMQKTANYVALKDRLNHKIKVMTRNEHEIIVNLIGDSQQPRTLGILPPHDSQGTPVARSGSINVLPDFEVDIPLQAIPQS